MKAPGFWWTCTPTWLARLLAPIGAIYGAATLTRMRKPGWRAPIPVICIGNYTVGGSGKTPAAIEIGRRLIAMGRRPFFLSRGYGGAEHGPALVDLARHGAADVGDEPLLLAATAPVVIARDREAGARFAIDMGADCIVMDDGLQNPTLAKTLTIAVVDGASGVGNGLVFPAGPLRAPVAGQAAHVDALLLIGAGAAGEDLAFAHGGKPILHATIEPEPSFAAMIRGRRVLALAGIGRPQKFITTLEACGAIVVDRHFVGDHMPYAPDELAKIGERAKASDLLVITTTKDQARMGTSRDILGARLIALPVSLKLVDEVVLDGLMKRTVT